MGNHPPSSQMSENQNPNEIGGQNHPCEAKTSGNQKKSKFPTKSDDLLLWGTRAMTSVSRLLVLLQNQVPGAIDQLVLHKTYEVKNPEDMKNGLKKIGEKSLAKWKENEDFQYRLIQILD